MSEYLQEREFILKARSGLECLHAMDQVYFETQTAVQILHDIETATLPVYARGIAKACALCLTYLEEVGRDAKVSDGFVHAFFGLKTLITQYTDGLLEIDPEFSYHLDVPMPVKMSEKFVSENASANTLSPLIRFAQTDKQRNALTFLTQFDADKDIILPRSFGASGHYEREETTDFDRVLQLVSAATLRAARLRSKSVSFSYISELEVFPTDRATVLQSALVRTGETIIAFGVRTETKQISLNVAETGFGLKATVNWYGRPLSVDHIKRLRYSTEFQNEALAAMTVESAPDANGIGVQTLTLDWPFRLVGASQGVVNESVQIGARA